MGNKGPHTQPAAVRSLPPLSLSLTCRACSLLPLTPSAPGFDFPCRGVSDVRAANSLLDPLPGLCLLRSNTASPCWRTYSLQPLTPSALCGQGRRGAGPHPDRHGTRQHTGGCQHQARAVPVQLHAHRGLVGAYLLLTPHL